MGVQQARVPAGSPVGGRFAAASAAESQTSLSGVHGPANAPAPLTVDVSVLSEDGKVTSVVMVDGTEFLEQMPPARRQAVVRAHRTTASQVTDTELGAVAMADADFAEWLFKKGVATGPVDGHFGVSLSDWTRGIERVLWVDGWESSAQALSKERLAYDMTLTLDATKLADRRVRDQIRSAVTESDPLATEAAASAARAALAEFEEADEVLDAIVADASRIGTRAGGQPDEISDAAANAALALWASRRMRNYRQCAVGPHSDEYQRRFARASTEGTTETFTLAHYDTLMAPLVAGLANRGGVTHSYSRDADRRAQLVPSAPVGP